jgi:hypothetical protein
MLAKPSAPVQLHLWRGIPASVKLARATLLRSGFIAWRSAILPSLGAIGHHWPPRSRLPASSQNFNSRTTENNLLLIRNGGEQGPAMLAKPSRPVSVGQDRVISLDGRRGGHVSRKVIKTLNSTDGRRRILVVQRPDGYFGLVEQYWYEVVDDGRLITEGWASPHAPSSIFETLEIAEREAKVHYHWIAP